MATKLVTLRRFDTEAEAEFHRSALEEAGITAFLENASVVNANWAWGNAVGYVQLRVPEDMAQKAEQLLAARPITQDLPENSCLQCGAKMPPHLHTCAACGWSYAEEEPEPDAADAPPSRSSAIGIVAALFVVVLVLILLSLLSQFNPYRGD